MIYDHIISKKIEEVNTQLVDVFERIAWPVVVDGTPITSSISILQTNLNDIKHIIDSLDAHIKNETSQRVYNIEYKKINHIIKELSRITPQTPLEREIFNILNKYITIICYYTLITKLLSNLPRDYDDQSYYKSVISSTWNKLIYSFQTNSFNYKISLKNIVDYKNGQSETWRSDIRKLFMIKNIQLIGIPTSIKKETPWKVIKFVLWQQPLHKINTKLSKIIATNHEELFEQTQKLGHLISLSDNGSLDLTLLNQFISITSKEFDSKDNIVKEICEFNKRKRIISYPKPHFLTRYWPILLVSFLYGPGLIRYLWDSRFNLQDFIQKNIIDLSKDLIHNWVWLPFKRVLATIRHDESTMIAMVSKDTVQSEQDSLIRMIIKFLLDNGAIKASQNITQDEMVNNIIKQIELGQMDQFMTIYESQLSQPIKNTMNGKLIRSILIQIQKMKVDGSIAMNGIDKMLKSQELLFGMIALSPSFFIIILNGANGT